MTLRSVLLAGVMAPTLLSIAGPVLAQDGPYLQMDLGIAVASSMAVDGTDNDWGTKCDLLVNPTGVEVTNECGAAPRRWCRSRAAFDSRPAGVVGRNCCTMPR